MDAPTLQEDGRAGADDEAVLERATSLGRVLFMRDADLLAIASALRLSGRGFSGIIYAHQLRVSIRECIREHLRIAAVRKLGEPPWHLDLFTPRRTGRSPTSVGHNKSKGPSKSGA